MIEMWKEVVGYEGLYSVSDHGNVRAEAREQSSYGGRTWHRPRRAMKITDDGRGYQVVTLAQDGERKRFYVHSLVLEAFLGPRPPGMQGCHGDGVRSNNRIGNLRWGSSTDNMNDRALHGTWPAGDRHPRAKYGALVPEIRRLLADGLAPADVSRQTGAPAHTVYAIKHGRQWSSP